MNPLSQIRNYYPLDERLASSGQPEAEQFQAIAEAGYEVVVNLALPTSDNAIAQEGSLVSALGLSYVQVPVRWDAPSIADVLLFCTLMQAMSDKKIWVHCAWNMRVSCFFYLYRKHLLNLSERQARFPMSEIWEPEGIWRELVDAVDVHFARSDAARPA